MIFSTVLDRGVRWGGCDLILMDLYLPTLDGDQAAPARARQIRELQPIPLRSMVLPQLYVASIRVLGNLHCIYEVSIRVFDNLYSLLRLQSAEG